MTQATAPVAQFQQRLFRTRPEDSLPLKVKHQRIYILPTRRGIAFLFSLLMMLIASVNYALSLGYALSFLLTGLFAASLLHTYKNVAGLTIKKLDIRNAFVGESAAFSLVIANDTELSRVGITLKANKVEDTVDVASHAEASATLSRISEQRGRLPPGRVTITSTYPLGLWRTWCYLHTGASAIVYPKAENSPPPLPVQNNDVSGDNSQRAIQGDIDGIREYQPGDAISSIAWKSAARGQGLYVKTFEQNKVGGDVYLNLASTGLPEIENQLSRLCAWILSAEHAQADYSLTIAGQTLDSAHGHAHKVDALTALALYPDNY